jgi:hypothetical protein
LLHSALKLSKLDILKYKIRLSNFLTLSNLIINTFECAGGKKEIGKLIVQVLAERRITRGPDIHFALRFGDEPHFASHILLHCHNPLSQLEPAL